MMFATRRLLWPAAGVLVLTAAALGAYLRYRLAAPLVLDAPPPPVVADSAVSAPDVAASSVEVLVTYNLSTAVDSLEAAVPRVYGDIDEKLPLANAKRASIAYALRRSPFRVHVTGQTLSISADVEYQGRVWYRPPIGPELSAGCGVGDDPHPRVRVTLGSTAQLTPRWQLRTDTRVQRLEPFSDEPRDRCRLTILRIDVTDRVLDATRKMLEQNLEKFDAAAARWPVRARFLQAWALLQRRIPLTRGVYLEIQPYAAQLGSVGAVGDTVMARLRMVASPRVVSGTAPGPVRPLPPLELGSDHGTGARVTVDASFTYPVASALLRSALVGKSMVQEGRRIEIRDVQLTGIGGGRVALSVTLAGRVRGRLYFTGTPSLDPVHHQISVPDLDFDVGTAQMLVSGFAWLKGVDIRNFLRDRARLPDAQAVGKLRGLAESGVNRTLAPGVTLSGRIHDARATAVRTTTREIRLRAVADAEFRLAIDRGPKLPRPPLSRPTAQPGH